MTFPRFTSVLFVLLFDAIPVFAQSQETGTADYALGNSSVMWLPRSSSVFLNPGELARVHQDEFLVTASRFNSLAAMSGALFVPNTGTFGLGVSPHGSSGLYSIGFGHLIGDYHTVGGALSVLSNARNAFRFSVGGSVHFPSGEKESGALAGLSVMGLATKATINLGAGYWVMPNTVRVQFASRSGMERAAFLGTEAKVMDDFHVQLGVRGFKKFLGGLSYTTSYATLELGGGPEGISFSMNVRVGDAASDSHTEAYNQGNEAFADERYVDARNWFLTALQYDEYDGDSRALAERSQRLMDSLVTTLLRKAQESETHQNFTEAMRTYAQILKIDPELSAVASQLSDVENKVKNYVQQLLTAGDSLRNIRQPERARQSYNLALEMEPDNEIASNRIDELENLSKENVKTILAHAKSLVAKNQLDEAQKEYQRVLSIEPTSSQAKSGLHAIRNRRFRDQMAEGKSAYEARKYFDALTIFSNIVREDENNKDGQTYLVKTRDALKSEIPSLFKTGLQFYIKEEYKAAIATWDKILMIRPQDSSTLEYRKRAEEKMKALEQFK